MIRQDFLEAAKAERDRLLQELRKTILFQEYQALNDLIVTATGGQLSLANQASQAPPTAHTKVTKTRGSRVGSRQSEIATAAAKWFEGRPGKRAQSLEIMRALEEKGFEFLGEKPTAGLASILSHSDLFDNVRGEGYGLKAWVSSEELHNHIDTQPGETAEHTAADLPDWKVAAD